MQAFISPEDRKGCRGRAGKSWKMMLWPGRTCPREMSKCAWNRVVKNFLEAHRSARIGDVRPATDTRRHRSRRRVLVTATTGSGVSRMSSLQVPELRLPVDDSDGGGPGGGGPTRGTVPLLLVPPSNVPRRRHSWICGWVHKSGRHPDSGVCRGNLLYGGKLLINYLICVWCDRNMRISGLFARVRLSYAPYEFVLHSVLYTLKRSTTNASVEFTLVSRCILRKWSLAPRI